jgi:predicted short-subunit dehydrogenase-like oxidoreductase (DUF2520 family)
LHDLLPDSDAILLAVKDDVIKELIKHPLLQDQTLIHTAGSIRLADLSTATKNAGSMWCVYSINKNHLPDRTDIPVIINGSNPSTISLVTELTSCITRAIYQLNDEEKSITHLAAVFANNFANFMFTVGQDILQDAKIPFDILIPLIENTVEKLHYSKPDHLQTGPAIRHDIQTLNKHRKMLQGNDYNARVYELLTQMIQEKYPHQ